MQQEKISMGRTTQKRQTGMTLIELMIAMMLGLMVILAALGTLLMTRSVSSTTDELASMQQDASFAMATLGRLIRQAGSLEPSGGTGSSGYSTVGFNDRVSTVVSGTNGGSGPDSLSIGTQSGTSSGANFDCLGNLVSTPEFISTFDVNNNALRCSSSGTGDAQPIIGHSNDIRVMDFQVRYRVVTRSSAGAPSFSMVDTPPPTPTSESDPTVTAIHVCLELEGRERIETDGMTYTNCQGDASATMDNRIKRVYRNVFNLRVLEL